jgi:hypothetical protein
MIGRFEFSAADGSESASVAADRAAGGQLIRFGGARSLACGFYPSDSKSDSSDRAVAVDRRHRRYNAGMNQPHPSSRVVSGSNGNGAEEVRHG